AVNDAPTAATDSESTAEDTALTFPASDLTTNDSKGPEIGRASCREREEVKAAASTHSTKHLTADNVTSAPDANYNGPASFTYHVCYNSTTHHTTSPSYYSSAVCSSDPAVNDAPTAVTDSKSTAEDTALTFPASDLTTNDSKGP